MDKPRPWHGDITPLLPYLNEPYRQDEVIAAARTLVEPFTIGEVLAVLDLPKFVVHRCLTRLTHKGVLSRRKGPLGKSGWATRPIYIYTFTEGR